MIQKFFSLLFILALPHVSKADDRNCYNWYGEKESCHPDKTRRETTLAVEGLAFYGERDASLTGSYGGSVLLTNVKSMGALRFMFGGQLTYSGANAYFNDVAYATQMMGADLIFGASIKPYRHVSVMPVIELAAIGGFRSFTFTNPPATVDRKELVPSYGGRLNAGIEFRLSRFYSLKPSLSYQVMRLPGVIDGEKMTLDSLGVSLGLVFQ